MKPIYKSIARGFRTLNLQPGWDDDGALAADEHAFCRAMEFMLRLVRTVGTDVVRPYINLCPNGTIDISFRKMRRKKGPDTRLFDARLLINFSREHMGWYGDDMGNEMTKGTQKEFWDDGLAEWIRTYMKEEPAA